MRKARGDGLRGRLSIAIATALVWLPTVAASETMSFQDGVAPTATYAGMRDTTLLSNATSTVAGSASTLEVDGSPDKSVLLRWDLSAIPVGATVQAVSLSLYVVDPSNHSYELYEMKRAWVESQATWLVFANGSPWEVAGAQGAADRGNTVLGSVGPAATGIANLSLNTSGVGLVQRWLANPSSNQGLILQDYSVSNGLDFSSREAATASRRPRLTVTYSLPSSLPTVSVAATDASASESGDRGTFTLARSGATTAPLSVSFTIAGSATAGADYTALTSPITIPAGAASVAIDVLPLQDTLAEGNETVALTLAGSASYAIGVPSSATITIADDDTSPTLTVSFQDGVAPTAAYAGTRDTKLSSEAPTTTYGTATTLEADGSPDKSVLLKWDVSQLPLGAVVEAASITLNVTDASTQDYEVYELKRSWLESQASWNVAATGAPWEIAGAQGTTDRGTSVLGAVGPSGTGVSTYTLNAAGRALVQRWAADPASNLGLVVQDYVSATNGIDFSSREVATASLRPRLTVTYSTSAPLPTVTVVASDASASESGDRGAFTFTRTGGTASALQVLFSVAGSATSGADYQAVTSPVTIPAGATTATLDVLPLQDALVEGNENVILTLASSSGYVVGGQNTATVVIVDDDTSPGPVEVSIVATDPSASESGGPGVFTITRTGPTTSPLAVYHVRLGSALEGPLGMTSTDYPTLPQPIWIPAGSSSTSVQIIPVDDSDSEGPETVILALAAGNGYVVAAPSSATITIADNDPPPAYEVTIVATDPTASESAPNDRDALFTVSRTGPTDTALDISYKISGTASGGGDDYALTGDASSVAGWVTIPSGASAATITLTVIDDALVEGTETAVLTLNIQPGGLYGPGDASSATVTISDDEAPPDSVVVSIAAPPLAVLESDPSKTGLFTIRRTGPIVSSLPVLLSINGTATNGVDYQRLPDRVSIPADSSSAYLVVQAIDDALDEGTFQANFESVRVTIQPDTAYIVGAPASAVVNISDDEGGCGSGASTMAALLAFALVGLAHYKGRRHRIG